MDPVVPGLWVSVDPGKRLCGVAVWRGSQLVRAGLVTTELEGPARWGDLARKVAAYAGAPGGPVETVQHLTVEMMQVYAHDGAAKAADLLDLAAVGGAVAGHLQAPSILAPLPGTWKGQVPRDVLAEREVRKWGVGDPRIEKPRSKKLLGDVMAALALGRWTLGEWGTTPR